MNNIPLFHRLIGVVRLRSGPQDLPASTNLLITAVVVSAVTSAIGLTQFGGPENIMLQIAAATVFSLGFVWAALRVRGGTNRFLQTATALFATDALLTLIALPAGLGIDPAAEEASVIAATWLLAVLLWTLAVIGHIFRHALDLPLAGGILVALLYMFLALNLSTALA